MIRYQDVGMKYGENTILEHIDLEIDAGEFFVLVAPVVVVKQRSYGC